MNRIYLNELSLEGQFENLNKFFCEIKSMIKCLKYVNEQGGKIYKSSDFYERKITPDKTWNVSAKYCYVTRKLRLHQNDRCKRFPLF